MKKFIQKVITSALIVGSVSMVAVPLMPEVAGATPQQAVCGGINSTAGGGTTCDTSTFSSLLKKVINILLFIIGTIAVIMIIVGGIRYVTSGGDQAAVTSAKNTVLYSIVGVVVAVMAYALVNFVIGAL